MSLAAAAIAETSVASQQQSADVKIPRTRQITAVPDQEAVAEPR